MKIKTLEEAFLVKLKAVYGIEKEIIKALPKLAKSASNSNLKTAFRDHLDETRVHVKRLEEVFEDFGKKPTKLVASGIRGIAEDADWIIKQKPVSNVLDAMLVTSAQYVEHYEMASYRALEGWAHLLGHERAAEMLHQTLEEEKAADEKLYQLALGGINESALSLSER